MGKASILLKKFVQIAIVSVFVEVHIVHCRVTPILIELLLKKVKKANCFTMSMSDLSVFYATKPRQYKNSTLVAPNVRMELNRVSFSDNIHFQL